MSKKFGISDEQDADVVSSVDTTNIVDILEKVKEFCMTDEMALLRTSNRGEYVQKCGKKFEELGSNFKKTNNISIIEQFGFLFNKVIDEHEHFDMNHLRKLLGYKSNVVEGKISYKDSSINYGAKHFSKYCGDKTK
jgi:hypothetical protein